MSNLVKRKSRKRRTLRLMLLIFAWSVAIGWVLGLATSVHGVTPSSNIGTVDVVPPQYQLAEELYLENCATCHIALPPAVFPTQTWRDILRDSQHYGVQIQPLVDPQRILVWRYLSTFSRTNLQEEPTPYRLYQSRYFRALHPGIKLPSPSSVSSCISCHPGASEYNFRRLSQEFE
ncbi:cytochrome C [Richelia sinica]|nr:cytochrome C [Richelia sinica]MBD2663175.1 cytochrome C [Richelia sinica FACHB-800]